MGGRSIVREIEYFVIGMEKAFSRGKKGPPLRGGW